MRLVPLKSAEEMEAEYYRRLQPGKCRAHVLALAVAVLSAYWLVYGGDILTDWAAQQEQTAEASDGGGSGGGRTEPPDQNSW